jgi:hypothetical protein
MVNISANNIYMTRGDTVSLQVEIKYSDGTLYELEEGDRVNFGCKEDYDDTEYVIYKELGDDLVLTLLPEDTANLEMPSTYVYNIEVIFSGGEVNTVIKGRLVIQEEVIYGQHS